MIGPRILFQFFDNEEQARREGEGVEIGFEGGDRFVARDRSGKEQPGFGGKAEVVGVADVEVRRVA